MESEPQKKIANSEYRVVWHPSCKGDLSEINSNIAEGLIRNVDHKLSQAPLLIGAPLKGASKLIYKVGYTQKYRVLYIVNQKTKEVWVLAVRNRNSVYKAHQFQHMVHLANNLHAAWKKHS